MRGRDKIEAALSSEGTREIPAVICYEGIYIRDHWSQLTAYPWWYRHAPDVERQMLWRREVMAGIGQDWFDLPSFLSREERKALDISVRPDGVYEVDRRTGHTARLAEAPVGGAHIDTRPAHAAETTDQIDALISVDAPAAPPDCEDAGRGDLAAALLREFGEDLFPTTVVGTPLESCALNLWGFEQTMLYIATRPDLVEHACRRLFPRYVDAVRRAARRGVAGIFVEDFFTDIISPEAFARLNVPFSRQLVEEIHGLGMKSIYYFCGNPAGRWDLLFSIGADALSLEESKKGFTIDIDDVVERVSGRCAVLGNLDAIGVLQDGSEEELRAEIARQIAAGRRNGSRFVMSLGSPVTPGTPAARVRLYCDLVHELGRM